MTHTQTPTHEFLAIGESTDLRDFQTGIRRNKAQYRFAHGL